MSKYTEEALAELEELKADCGYHEEREGSVDDLIAFKDALEDRFVTLTAKARAWDALDRALDRNARGASHASAADVCAVGFAQQEALRDG